MTVTELIGEMEIRTRSPYKRLFNKEILPIIRENIEHGEVILRESYVREKLNIDNGKLQTKSLYVRLKMLSAPEFDVSLGTHLKDNTRVFSFYKKIPKDK